MHIIRQEKFHHSDVRVNFILFDDGKFVFNPRCISKHRCQSTTHISQMHEAYIQRILCLVEKIVLSCLSKTFFTCVDNKQITVFALRLVVHVLVFVRVHKVLIHHLANKHDYTHFD